MESQSRRENIIIHNLPAKEEGVEQWSETEEKVQKHFKDMGFQEDIKIDRAHRLNPRKLSSPLVVKLTYYKDKEKIIEKARAIKREKRQQRRGEDDTEMSEPYVNEDYTARVRRARQLLRPGLMDAIKKNKRAYLSYDKLVIDGKNHWYDDEKKAVSENKPENMCCSELRNKLFTLE